MGTEFIGTGTTSLASDFYFRSLTDSRVVDDLAAKPAPLGPRDEVRALVTGFVDGFNAYLAEGNAVECSGADWVRPMQEIDVYRRVYAVELRMGQAFFASSIILSRVSVARSACNAAMNSKNFPSAYASSARGGSCGPGGCAPRRTTR